MRGLWGCIGRVLDSFGVLFPVFDYVTKYRLYKPAVWFYDTVVFEVTPIVERHQGVLRSVLGLGTVSALIHEYAHTELHFDTDDRDGRAKREVEAEAVTDVVGRYLDLDTSNSAFYLAASQGEESVAVRDRIHRISMTFTEMIEMTERSMDRSTPTTRGG